MTDKKFFIISNGEYRGMYDDWLLTAELSQGASGVIQCGYRTLEEAEEAAAKYERNHPERGPLPRYTGGARPLIVPCVPSSQGARSSRSSQQRPSVSSRAPSLEPQTPGHHRHESQTADPIPSRSSRSPLSPARSPPTPTAPPRSPHMPIQRSHIHTPSRQSSGSHYQTARSSTSTTPSVSLRPPSSLRIELTQDTSQSPDLMTGVYKFNRSLSGIVSIVPMMLSRNQPQKIYPFSFGDHADRYLRAHGYDEDEDLRIIWSNYSAAENVEESFCEAMRHHKMSDREAAYLFYLIGLGESSEFELGEYSDSVFNDPSLDRY